MLEETAVSIQVPRMQCRNAATEATALFAGRDREELSNVLSCQYIRVIFSRRSKKVLLSVHRRSNVKAKLFTFLMSRGSCSVHYGSDLTGKKNPDTRLTIPTHPPPHFAKRKQLCKFINAIIRSKSKWIRPKRLLSSENPSFCGSTLRYFHLLTGESHFPADFFFATFHGRLHENLEPCEEGKVRKVTLIFRFLAFIKIGMDRMNFVLFFVTADRTGISRKFPLVFNTPYHYHLGESHQSQIFRFLTSAEMRSPSTSYNTDASLFRKGWNNSRTTRTRNRLSLRQKVDRPSLSFSRFWD